jgi:hypothetical protein
MRVQRHGLLGHRRTQPLDLRAGRRQLDLLRRRSSRAPRHRGSQRRQGALLGDPADVHHRGAIDPQLAAASRWVACWVRTCTNNSYFSEDANRLRGVRPDDSDMISNLPRVDQTSPWVVGY